MARTSAGVLLYRRTARGLEVFLAHPGGPLFARKDEGAWTLPKGEPDDGEALEGAARRELVEETGLQPPDELVGLGSVTQRGGKVVHAWAGEGSTPAGWELRSNTFELQWPPHSGRVQRFPEIDRVGWFDLVTARSKINPAQVALIDRLEEALLG